jgi:hypothetical protein
MDLITRMAVERAEQMGIIFIDGIDKVAGRESGHGGNVGSNGNLNESGNVTINGTMSTPRTGVGNCANGAVVVAKTLDPLYNPLAAIAPGTVNIQINGGGHGGIQYESGCIAMANSLSTFHVVAIRELMN